MKKVLSIILCICLFSTLMAMADRVQPSTYKTVDVAYGTPVVDPDCTVDDIWQNTANKIVADQVAPLIAIIPATAIANVWTLWDENNFYILAVVDKGAGEVHIDDVTDPVDEARDCVEFQLDVDNNKDASATDNIPTGNPHAGAFRCDGRDGGTISGFGDWFTAVQDDVVGYCKVTSESTYRIEMSIPWPEDFTPAADKTIGFEVQVNVNDDGVQRTGLVTWNDPECWGWNDTRALGYAVLKAPTAAPTEAPTQAPTQAPVNTGDVSVAVFALVAAAAACGFVVSKKKVK